MNKFLADKIILSDNKEAAIREILSEDRTYYVRTDGSDDNNGLTNDANGAFLTIQKAVNVVCGNLDCANYKVTIQVANGTYSITSAIQLGSIITGRIVSTGDYPAQILGDEDNPGNVVIDSSGGVFSCSVATSWGISGFKFTCPSGTNSSIVLNVSGGGFVTLGAVEFGAWSTGNHIVAQNFGFIQLTKSYTISGGTARHFYAQGFGIILAYDPTPFTITCSGTPNFSTAFALVQTGGFIRLYSTTVSFSGSATGKRYDVKTNGIIMVTTGSSTTLPGDSSGTTATQGQYIV